MPFKTKRPFRSVEFYPPQILQQPVIRLARRPGSFACSMLVLSILLLPCAARCASEKRRVIWSFDHTLTNTLGGLYNSFSGEPSWARTYLDPDIHLSGSRHSLRITAHREWKGFCGVWLNFYSSSTHRYFDARPYPYLTFWIKGQKPGGNMDIKIVDAQGELKEDTLATRPLHAYLPQGITTLWQKVIVPLSDFPETDPSSLARLVLIFPIPGDFQIYLGDVALESTPDARAPMPPVVQPLSRQPPKSNIYHSMWVWNTETMLRSEDAANRFFNFCSRTGLKEIYLSVDFRGSASGISDSIENSAAYGDFLSAAHLRGLRVEALAGAPIWAAGVRHQRALSAVRAILSYNASMTPDGRFDGIHFDVEPYLLLGFSVPDYRQRILEQYLAMVAECAEAARSGGVEFTCDIPWWFFPVTPAARAQFTVNFRGKDETVGEHVTDLLNSVTIMDYRNEADGAGGIIRFGIPALVYAAKLNKRIRVGLETSAQKDTPVEFVIAIPERDFLMRLQEAHLEESSSFEGYPVHALHAGGLVFVGLGPRNSASTPRESSVAALARLREAFGLKKSSKYSVRNVMEQVRAAIAADPGWTDFEPETLETANSHSNVSAFRAIRRTPPMTTFHGLGRTIFEQESRSAAEWLGQYSSFGGIAVHYYMSFQEMMAAP